MTNQVTISGYFFIALFITSSLCEECNRIPLGIKTAPLPPDDRYFIKINNIGKDYTPRHTYKVVLQSKHNNTNFIAFTISASGDERANPYNPRKPHILNPGVLRISPDEDNAKNGPCNNSIMQNHIMPKTSVQVNWEAPPPDNGCVTIHAYVAIKPEVYYNNQAPLTKRVCEDKRKEEDMLPKVNANCQVCQDAKYKLTFEGLWSLNSHGEDLFPTSNTSLTQASFSEIVGASHNKDFNIFKSNDVASKGVRILAEQGNTTDLEMDMQEKIGHSIRSIIKTNKPATTTSTITAMFRVTREHHLVSLVTAILPSPDWFLGASHMELCIDDENQWTDHKTLNLYPMDAGTDKGTDFSSPNDEMMPPLPISPTKFRRQPKHLKPFARINFKLISVYDLTPGCFEKHENEGEGGDEDENGWEEEGGGEEEGDDQTEDEEEVTAQTTTSTTEAPVVTDPDSSSDCPMTAWEDWQPCDGPCRDGRREGAHTRYRYYIVDGVPLKYTDSEQDSQDKTVPEECMENYSDQETELCDEACEETTEAPVQSQQQIAPGHSWRNWFTS